MTEPLGERALRRLLAIGADDGQHDGGDWPPLPERYEIVRELGRGGMGVVFEVIDHRLGRRCALKTLGAGADVALRARFAREAAAAARLQHPHIAAVHDATPDFITMQCVAGGPIGCAPELPARRAVELVRDAALALHHAHEQGIVHRDLKPSNLLVEGDHVFVVDFGLAKEIDAASSVSLAGAVVGTPAFMPPEQALGQSARIDARSDVYALGATLHHCLTGRPPFAETDLPTLLRRVVEDDAAPTGVDRDLDLVLARCLAKEPERRYASARELADDLDRWLRDEPVHARAPSLGYRLRKRLWRQRRSWRAAALTAVLAVGATALVLVPAMLREGAARDAASQAVALADHVATVLRDAADAKGRGDQGASWARLEDGIAEVRAFVARHDVPRMRYLLARLLQAQSRADEALAELDRAIAGDPALGDARFERGLLLASRPELDAAARATAIADLGVATGDRSVLREVDRLFGRAELLRLQGNARRASELLREVLEHDGMHVPARLSLAAASRSLGDNAQSIYYAASALDLQQGYGPFYLARERQGLSTSILDLEGALIDFSRELGDAPDRRLPLANRGIEQLRRALRLADAGQLAEAVRTVTAALEDHRELVRLEPGLAGAFNNCAVCALAADRLLRANGDTAAAAEARIEAATASAAALRLAADAPEPHFNAGLVACRQAEVLRALGRPGGEARERAAAAAAFARALELAPREWPHARPCAERLASMRAAHR